VPGNRSKQPNAVSGGDPLVRKRSYQGSTSRPTSAILWYVMPVAKAFRGTVPTAPGGGTIDGTVAR
jgi:hypothetical protein